MTGHFLSVENEYTAEADERLTVGLLDGRTVRHLQQNKELLQIYPALVA